MKKVCTHLLGWAFLVRFFFLQSSIVVVCCSGRWVKPQVRISLQLAPHWQPSEDVSSRGNTNFQTSSPQPPWPLR